MDGLDRFINGDLSLQEGKKTQGLNWFEINTLKMAYNRLLENDGRRIMIPSDFKKCKQHLPRLIKDKLINVNHLKFAGAIALTDKGKETAKFLIDNNL